MSYLSRGMRGLARIFGAGGLGLGVWGVVTVIAMLTQACPDGSRQTEPMSQAFLNVWPWTALIFGSVLVIIVAGMILAYQDDIMMWVDEWQRSKEARERTMVEEKKKQAALMPPSYTAADMQEVEDFLARRKAGIPA